MVLHFVKDEKVTDQIIENFEKVNDECRFLVFLEIGQQEHKFIKSKSSKIIDFSHEKNNIMDVVDKYDPKAILLHSLQLDFAKVLLDIRKKVTIAWYPWGFDIYGLPRIKPQTYAPLTNNFLLETNPNLCLGRIILKYALLRKLFFKFKPEENRYDIIFKAIKKITYFASYIKEDFQVFSRAYPNSLQYIYSPFCTIAQYLAYNEEIELDQNPRNILIGNSNTPESNHLDVFEKLGEILNNENFEIYVPLSYGGDIEYQNRIVEKGAEKLGNSFSPLLNFMKREDYIGILKSCSTGIFYHYRQQAMGNIIAMLYMGARIYMSSKSPAFSFLRKKGIKVFDLDLEFELYKNSKLESHFVTTNKINLNTIFKEDVVLKDLEVLVKTISQ